jgi:hypothetical protein
VVAVEAKSAQKAEHVRRMSNFQGEEIIDRSIQPGGGCSSVVVGDDIDNYFEEFNAIIWAADWMIT